MNRQPLPDLTAFLACWAVLVVAGLTAATLAGQAALALLDALLRPLLLVALVACVVVAASIAHDVFTTAGPGD